MLISELKNNIVAGKVDNFYIFTGPEEGIMDIYVKQISKKLGLCIKWADSIQEISKSLNLKSLVKVKYLYLVRLDKGIKTDEKLWDFLKHKIVGNYIILIEPTLDKKLKFYKYFEDNVITFEKLSKEMLMQYGKRKCPKLSDNNLDKLCDWCGHSYLRYMNELDKIKTLSLRLGCDEDKSLAQLEKDNGIFKEREFDVLDYANHILTRDIETCYKDLDYAKSQNCELYLIGLLRNSFKNLVLFKNDGGGQGVCARTGLTGWQVKCAIETQDYYSTQEVEDILLFLQQAEVKLKTGGLDISVALNYILSEIL